MHFIFNAVSTPVRDLPHDRPLASSSIWATPFVQDAERDGSDLTRWPSSTGGDLTRWPAWSQEEHVRSAPLPPEIDVFAAFTQYTQEVALRPAK